MRPKGASLLNDLNTAIYMNEEDLVRKYRTSIRCMAVSLASSGLPNALSIGDLEQEGNLKLIQCWRRFRHMGGVDFWTYAQIRVLGHMRDTIRRIRVVKRREINTAAPFQEPGVVQSESSDDPLYLLLQKNANIDQEEKLRYLFRLLRPGYRKVMRLLMKGEKMTRVAAKCGITIGRVSQIKKESVSIWRNSTIMTGSEE